MSRFKAIVSYDGSQYGGWQRQIHASSIQEEIEQVLLRIQGHPVSITASGRTDAKVHALQQVFHYDSESNMEGMHWTKAMNALLPKDIRIQSVTQVSDDFHARFSAKLKRYDYLITDNMNNPFYERYMAKDYQALDVRYMQECASVFVGTHDFTSFTSNKIDPRKPRIKTISRLEVMQEHDYIRMIFEGNGFLRYMVRMLAQTIIEAGKHRITKQDVQVMLDGKNKHMCRFKAPAHGLYLIHVIYDEDLQV